MSATLLRDRRGTVGAAPAAPIPSDTHLDLLAEFSSELERLSTTQRELMQELRSDGYIDLDVEELPRLRKENAELRQRLEDMERLLHVVPAGGEVWAERQTEYEKLLDEKSEVIRDLHMKVQELQAGAVAKSPSQAQVDVQDAGLERQRREIAEMRRQLEEDEAALQEQARTMEMALAKDRAELARNRGELQRQQTDFTREVEIANRDPQLRERLANLQRRQPDTGAKKPASAQPTSPPAAPRKDSGLIRRLFG